MLQMPPDLKCPGACWSPENPSVVPASPSHSSRVCAAHTCSMAWPCHSRCPAAAARTGDKDPPPASPHPSKVLAQPHTCPFCPLGQQFFAFPGLQRHSGTLTRSESQETCPRALCITEELGIRTTQVLGFSLGTRDVTEHCSASLLCYYGDKHHGADRNKCIKIPSSFAPRVAVGSPGCRNLPSLPAPCLARWPPTPCDTQPVPIFAQSARLTAQGLHTAVVTLARKRPAAEAACPLPCPGCPAPAARSIPAEPCAGPGPVLRARHGGHTRAPCPHQRRACHGRTARDAKQPRERSESGVTHSLLIHSAA